MLRKERTNQLSKQLFWQDHHRQLVTPYSVSSQKKELSEDKVFLSSQESYPIPKLKTLDEMVRAIKASFPLNTNLSHVAIVAVQHNLETTATLFQAMQALGIKKIFTLGKCYSDSQPIVHSMELNNIRVIPSSLPKKIGHYQEAAEHDVSKLWQTCLADIKGTSVNTIIVLDDGGRCLSGIPNEIREYYKIAGVEQTRGGLYLRRLKNLLFPIVDVASSALKRHVESPFIAKAVLNKVATVLKTYDLMDHEGHPAKGAIIGVAGVGAVGAAIVRYLLSLGYFVNIYDKDEESIKKARLRGACRVGSLTDLVVNSKCILGCTGEDLTKSLALDEIVENDTILVSCSSEDKEYKTELLKIAKKSEGIIDIPPLTTFTAISNNGKKMIFVRGGFPANFDGLPWNVPSDEIEPTQGALLGAVYQAILLARKSITDGIAINGHDAVMLDPHIQRFIIETRCLNKSAKQHEVQLLEDFRVYQWVISESGKNNKYLSNPILAECFNVLSPWLDSSVISTPLPIRSHL